VLLQLLSDFSAVLFDYLHYQHNLNKPTDKSSEVDNFRNDFEKYGYEYVVKKYGDYSLAGFIKHCLRKTKAEIFN
jgi:hypothetical protein